MHDVDKFVQLAEEVHAHEVEGKQLSTTWYDFDQPNSSEVTRLKRICATSLQRLEELSMQLDHALRDASLGPSRDNLEHAHSIVQELIQSRTAMQELLQSMGDGNESFPEYFRAFSIKEGASAMQSEKLLQTLRMLH